MPSDRSFETILHEIEQASRESEPAGVRASASFWSELASLAERDAARHGFAERESILSGDGEPGEPGEPPTLMAPSTDPDAVRAELAEIDSLDLAGIHALRRRFARRNHPDFYGQEFAREATTRMQIANEIFDQAIARATTVCAGRAV